MLDEICLFEEKEYEICVLNEISCRNVCVCSDVGKDRVLYGCGDVSVEDVEIGYIDGEDFVVL